MWVSPNLDVVQAACQRNTAGLLRPSARDRLASEVLPTPGGREQRIGDLRSPLSLMMTARVLPDITLARPKMVVVVELFAGAHLRSG